MFENRISELFPQNPAPQSEVGFGAALQSPPFMPLVSLADVYQSAAARARRDYELDKLFNPDYYGDHGSGI